MITSFDSNIVMVEGLLVHEFGGRGSGPGWFDSLVGYALMTVDWCTHVVDYVYSRVQVFCLNLLWTELHDYIVACRNSNISVLCQYDA